MRKHLGLLTAGVTALALVLGVGPATQSAKAQFFEYTGVLTVTPIAGLNSTVVGNGSDTVTLTTSGGEPIVLNVPATTSPRENAGVLGTDIVYSTIDATAVTDNSSFQSPITFNFVYTLTITDYDSPTSTTPGNTGTIDIAGRLSGSIGAGRSVNLNDLRSYTTDPLNGQVMIGNTLYTISVGANHFTAPGANRLGTFGAHVQAQVIPEPVSMISMGLGFLGVGGFLARNRRRNRKALAA